MLTKNRIGFMQGRLSKIVDNKIQSFPWETWEEEFQLAKSINIKLMEWTLDYKDLKKNPLIDKSKKSKIEQLSLQNNVEIKSLTGDCFMQFPFWKYEGKYQDNLKKVFDLVLDSCVSNKIEIIVLPLVDNGSIQSFLQEKQLVDYLISKNEFLKKNNIKIAFESDFSPERLSSFINIFPRATFGINYDIGNSASLGFDPDEEFDKYANRIINVHVKDRKKGGSTVPLGTGDVNFEKVFKLIFTNNYEGNFILQAARCPQNNHVEIIDDYQNFVYKFITDSV